MATPLQSASIAAPGFFGLNTQESGITLESGFALQANNCVIDKFGRLGARKGWTFLDESTGINLKGMHRFVDIDASEDFGCWSDDSFYIYSGGALNQVTYSGSQSITEGNWQAVTLNDRAYLFQAGYEPLYFDTADEEIKDMSQAVSTATVTISSSSTTATVTHSSHGFSTGDQVTISGANEAVFNGTFTITVSDTDTYTYTMSNSNSNNPATGTITAAWYHDTPPEANVAMSAYGRVWAANTATNKTTLYWSDLLDGTDWSSGTAGFLDISSILVYGNDEIVALGAHNGAVIVFCKQNIIILGDSPADGVATQSSGTYNLDPTNLQLIEVISGVGCIARDSVQNTGVDIVFLSESGLRSLGRVIQEKSQPMRDLSKNVRDDLVQLLESETNSKIKSAYSEGNAFYLLAFPTTRQVYCFDMRQPLQDGSARITIWNNMDFTAWNAWENKVYMAHENGLAEYRGYQDNGQSYRMVYFTNYFDLGNASQTKILKRLAITVIGATGQDFVVKSGFDYNDVYNNYSLNVKQGIVYQYDNDGILQGDPSTSDKIAKYGIIGHSDTATQGATTITVPSDVQGTDELHYVVDFQTTSDSETYTVPYDVWLDSDTYYYSYNTQEQAITNITNASPPVVTVVGHGLTTGDSVYIYDVTGFNFTATNTDRTNGVTYTVTVIDSDTFSLDGVDGTLHDAYTSGGKIVTELGRTRTTIYVNNNSFETEYSGGTKVDTIRVAGSGSGSVMQLGFEADLNGGALSIQKMDIYVKQGRTL
jgi:hypothetical protein